MNKHWLPLVFLTACATSADPERPPPGTEPNAPEPTPPVENLRPMLEAQSFTTPVNEVLTDVIVAEDPEDDPLAFGLVRAPDHGALVLTTDGTFTYEPEAGVVGVLDFTVSVTDGFGDAVEAEMTIDVLAVGQPPVFPDAEFRGSADTPLSGLLVATDIDGDDLRFDLVAGTSFGDVQLDATYGTFIYTPDEGFTGTDVFDVEVTDGVYVVRATVTLVITTLGNLPGVPPTTFSGTEDTPLNGVLPVAPATGLTFAVDTPPRGGDLTLDPSTGQFTYTPEPDFNGLDDFTVVTVSAGVTSLPGRMTLVVAPVNDAPVVTAPAPLQTTAGTPIAGQVVAFDVEGDSLTFSKTAGPFNGTVTVSPVTGAFDYVPSAGFVGNDVFLVEADDGDRASTPAVVVIAVVPASP